jgi:plasmid stability protein
MASVLHLPLDWERAPEIRLFAMRLASSHCEGMAPLYYVRMWSEWGIAAVEWRPLRIQIAHDYQTHAWDREDLTFLIEQYCGWKGGDGKLVVAAIEAGVLRIERRGDLSGLVLSNFWRLNEHLSPDYKTIQQKGGLAKFAKRQSDELQVMAAQQERIMEAQGRLWLPEAAATAEERKAALALVMRLDRACGRSVRCSSEYDEELLNLALETVRKFTQDDIAQVEEFIFENRETPSVVKEPDRILMQFADLLERSRQ